MFVLIWDLASYNLYALCDIVNIIDIVMLGLLK